MKRRQLLKMLAVAPLIPLAAKLAPILDAPKFATLTVPSNMFIVGDIILLQGFRTGGPKGKFTITKVERNSVTVE